jgi:hypothetical protein
MALIPNRLRPSVMIRRKAMRRGILGPSGFWKLVAVFVFVLNTIKRVFGKTPDDLGTRTIGVGSLISVAVFLPMTRKEQKRRGITLASARADAAAELEAASPGS